jgi:hypothetical protein
MITYGTKPGFINTVIAEILKVRGIEALDPATEAEIRKEVADLYDMGFSIEDCLWELA